MKKSKDIMQDYIDPVFAKYGMTVYTYEGIEKLREENLKRKKDGKRIYELVPQKGFQENVLLCDADIKIIGGKRGGGKEQPYDALVLLPDHSWKRMGDIELGDIISDMHDNPQVVTGIFEQGVKEVYRVNTLVGSCECGLEHLWLVYLTSSASWEIHTTRTLMEIPNGVGVYLPSFKSDTEKLVPLISIEDTGVKKPCRCIMASGDEHLYVTDNFIVTHNTWLGLFEFLPYIFNPDVNGYGFRKYEDDVARGIWKSSKQVFKGFGSTNESSFEWKFLGGKGATMKMEHLQDQKKISDRFRGVEMAYILIEELAEHTRENMNTLFDLLASNRSTSGVKPKCICTCNPVGKSNKLRYFLDWWIDPETNRAIPERSGKIRYFYRYGQDVSEVAWGDTPEEVYNHPLVKSKLDALCTSTGQTYKDFITSLAFIDGDFKDNQILHVADAKYMARISARGGESTTNDIEGIWQDVDAGQCMLTMEEMDSFFDNTEHRDGFMRASCDVALTGDFFVIFAFDGHHIVDMEAWRGAMSESVIPFIEQFLKKNGVRKENFTYDANGLGLWLSSSAAFKRSMPFNNKSTSSDTRLWNNLKSECAEKFVKSIKQKEFSIAESLLQRQFTDKKGYTFSLRDRLMEERRALKRKENTEGGRFEIIGKPQMKVEIGHSPDFIEALFMVMHLFEHTHSAIRRGFDKW